MNDHLYMQRAIELAKLGIGNVSPNPAVGAVIVCDNTIIGEGYHKKCGEQHAEVNAINSVQNKQLLHLSTIYVTLEPCSHWGKTPPCTDLIIKHRFKRVVVGIIDPYYEVCGNGIKKLQNAGIEVTIGILEDQCGAINAPFLTSNYKKRPYIILKWAMSSDGFIDIKRDKDSSPIWFTDNICKTLVHKWRSEIDCIMVGKRTVELDNPELTVRNYFGKNPVRATIDGNLQLDTYYKIFNSNAKTILFTKKENFDIAIEKFKLLTNVEIAPIDYSTNIPKQICNYLFNKKLQSLFIEGGTHLVNSFITENLWDEAKIFTSNLSITEIVQTSDIINGVKAPSITGLETNCTKYQNCDFKRFISK